MTKFKSLYDWCIENKKTWLLEQWDDKKNYPLSPKDIPFGSTKKYSWTYVYSKMDGGKFTFEWINSPNRRTTASLRSDSVCPFVNGNVLYKGFNDLETKNPTLAKMWHPTKNGNLKPSDVMAGSCKKVWWQLSYHDLKTNKIFDFEWEDSIKTMNKEMSNPYISNHKVFKGFNDLETWCKVNKRKDILLDWNEKSNNFKPTEIIYGSPKRISWKCHVCGHEWNTKLVERTKHHTKCPNCNKWYRTSFPEQVILYYLRKSNIEVMDSYKPNWLSPQELDIYLPVFKVAIEYDGSKYHQNVSKDLLKAKTCNKNGVKLIRIRESKCPPFMSNECSIIKLENKSYEELKKAILEIFKTIDFNPPEIDILKDSIEIKAKYYVKKREKSLSSLYPSLCKEWHPTLNGSLNPEMFAKSSSESVWWKCAKCGNEWKTIISNRTGNNSQCPVCAIKSRTINQTKIIMCRETGDIFMGTKEAAIKYNVSDRHVSNCCRKNKPLLKKYHLVYIDSFQELHKRIGAQKSSSLFNKD